MPGNDIKYFFRSIAGRFAPARMVCPNCGSRSSNTVQRKKLVTSLVRCSGCRLLYRIPTDLPSHNFDFYQESYSHGFTTDCPSDDSLQQLLSTKFAASEKDYSLTVSILRALGVEQGAKILDFGCSWGYGTWQLRDAGYEVVGYELSQSRARFARDKLGLAVIDELSKIDFRCDVFFSSHVLEHVPSPQQVIELAKRLLLPGGIFVAFTPNGSSERLERSPASFRAHWGYLHPNMLDNEFYETALEESPRLLASNPYGLKSISGWDRSRNMKLDLSGNELMIVAQLTSGKADRGDNDAE